tara:strand:+ start:366 stop:716 length:351 start_codon:yes stop_codon:yes gene_type:complete
MIDTDKYEPTRIDTLLHNTRAHSPDGWRELSKSLIELSDDDRLLIANASKLRAEVLRLREENEIFRKQAFDLHYMICINFIENLTPKELYDKVSVIYNPHSTHTTTNQPLFGIGDW